jgi:hypothetical protein
LRASLGFDQHIFHESEMALHSERMSGLSMSEIAIYHQRLTVSRRNMLIGFGFSWFVNAHSLKASESRHTTLWATLRLYLCLIAILAATGSAKDAPKVVPIGTSVCEVTANPTSFDGKVVSLRATVLSGFEVFAIKPPEGECGGMWLAYSEGGPVASTALSVSRPPRDSVTILKDRNFKRFQSLLNAEMHPRTRESMCMGCNRYEVSATMVGRVDYAGEQAGYGHMNGYKLQFELMSVSDITAKDLSARYDSAKFSTDPVHLPTGYIEGTLIAPDGKKYEDIWITATHPHAENEFQSTGDADTDKNGRFKVSVPPGEYVVGVNVIRPASEPFPFRRTYSPAAESYTSAQVYTVADGEHVRADIYLKGPLSLRSIPVSVQWPDGRAVEDANVWLTEALGDPNIVVDTAVSHTRADGTFTLKGVVETDYLVHADIYVKPGYRKFCAQDITVRSNDQPTLVRFVLDHQGAACGN